MPMAHIYCPQLSPLALVQVLPPSIRRLLSHSQKHHVFCYHFLLLLIAIPFHTPGGLLGVSSSWRSG